MAETNGSLLLQSPKSYTLTLKRCKETCTSKPLSDLQICEEKHPKDPIFEIDGTFNPHTGKWTSHVGGWEIAMEDDVLCVFELEIIDFQRMWCGGDDYTIRTKAFEVVGIW